MGLTIHLNPTGTGGGININKGANLQVIPYNDGEKRMR